ncbi:MAG: RNA polymerase sigma factor, partial [Bacteroidota bacterium]
MKKDKHIDVKLVESYQSGDPLGLVGLVKRWHLDFCRRAYFILKDPDLAKDIAQECWKTIMDKIVDLNEPERFGAWAMRIVYSKSLDTLRHQSSERQKREAYATEHHSKIDELHSENDTLQKELLKAINALPEHQLAVVKLFYVEDYSLKEIAQIVGVSVGTVKSRLFHAREKLKE